MPLHVRLHPDGIDCTHLCGHIGITLTLQELPERLGRKLKPFIQTLADLHVSNLSFRREDLPNVLVDNICLDLARFARNPDHIAELLELVTWWMEYRRVRLRCGPHIGTKNPFETWSCPDCRQESKPDMDLCSDPTCPSWNKLYKCTGDPRLRSIVLKREHLAV